ncbi:hypothetical protein N303_15519, partial [Cuculus canorus]
TASSLRPLLLLLLRRRHHHRVVSFSLLLFFVVLPHCCRLRTGHSSRQEAGMVTMARPGLRPRREHKPAR